jgi:mono/diheme cytochrome c family protein
MSFHLPVFAYKFQLPGLFLILLAILPFGLNACSNAGEADQAKTVAVIPDYGDNVLGHEVYRARCKICHGLDGALGLSGAANLVQSKLDEDSAYQVILLGRNGMQSFQGALNEDEIRAVIDYLQLFKATE